VRTGSHILKRKARAALFQQLPPGRTIDELALLFGVKKSQASQLAKRHGYKIKDTRGDNNRKVIWTGI
jgi:hypothetical protein